MTHFFDVVAGFFAGLASMTLIVQSLAVRCTTPYDSLQISTSLCVAALLFDLALKHCERGLKRATERGTP